MALKIVTAPAAEPVSLTEAKLHLRIDHSTEDDLITGLITTAREEIERMTDVMLITQTWDWSMDAFFADEIKVPLWPLASVSSIKYLDENSAESTIAATNYAVDTASRPGRIAWKSSYSLPSVELYPVNAVTVRMVVGFGTAGTNVPKRFIQALKLLVGHYYENREAVYSSVGGNVIDLPRGMDALLAGDLRRFG